jgi:D-alanyl-D-alanine carboxypeptidase
VGVKAADRVSARPGTSEHQLGLAMDVAKKGSSSLTKAFGKTEQGQWVSENAHKFGFIVRYLEDSEEVTGYSYEPWHLRYVGVEYATAIYQSGLPMELYMSGHRLELFDYLIHQATNEVLP